MRYEIEKQIQSRKEYKKIVIKKNKDQIWYKNQIGLNGKGCNWNIINKKGFKINKYWLKN
jgi:hypothetical protein